MPKVALLTIHGMGEQPLDYADDMKRMLAHRMGAAFADVEVNPRRCWAGMYEMTPDHHAIIGRAPGVEGLFLANGFSGHGVMHSPATGKIISELIVDGAASFVDASKLRAERFAEGNLLEETAVL